VTQTLPALGTILCAVDESDMSAAVIYTAAGLAAHPTSQLIVLHVKGGLQANGARAAAQRDLGELVERAVPGWMSYREATKITVASGSPSEAILSEAARRGANMIVVGTHRHGRLAQVILGSVTADVLRRANVPVAVVSAEAREVIALTSDRAVPHVGSILVPVDLESGSTRQLSLASILSLTSDRPIDLLHVIPENADSSEPLARLQEMARYIDSNAGARAIVTHGSLIKVILERQRREHAGLVVLGRDDASPGHVVRALLQQTHAVVFFVP